MKVFENIASKCGDQHTFISIVSEKKENHGVTSERSRLFMCSHCLRFLTLEEIAKRDSEIRAQEKAD
jgi:hypothetical protein